MIPIPAIDLINGKCVRLSQGDFSSEKVYAENPVDVARSFEDAGLDHVHVVDLDGAKSGKVRQWRTVESIASQTKLKVDFGGGIKTEAEINRLFDLGVQQVNLGSVAYREPMKVRDWINKFGAERIILSADVKNNLLAVSGWQDSTQVTVTAFIRDFVDAGLKYATCTDISKDGMLKGPNNDLYKSLAAQFPTLNLIASGGVHSINDLIELGPYCYGCIVGKAIYENKITLSDLSSLEK